MLSKYKIFTLFIVFIAIATLYLFKSANLSPESMNRRISVESEDIASINSDYNSLDQQEETGRNSDSSVGLTEESDFSKNKSKSVNQGGKIKSIDNDCDRGIPIFKFPFPKPSYAYSINNRYFEGLSTLNEINTLVSAALSESGYFEKKYFAMPCPLDGFAVAARIERINNDGSLIKGKFRWILDDPVTEFFSIKEYLKSLFYADPGMYRMIVFLSPIKRVEFSDEILSREKANTLFNSGSEILTDEILNTQYDGEGNGRLLVYEFEVTNNEPKVKLNTPGVIPLYNHLQGISIEENLKKSL